MRNWIAGKLYDLSLLVGNIGKAQETNGNQQETNGKAFPLGVKKMFPSNQESVPTDQESFPKNQESFPSKYILVPGSYSYRVRGYPGGSTRLVEMGSIPWVVNNYWASNPAKPTDEEIEYMLANKDAIKAEIKAKRNK